MDSSAVTLGKFRVPAWSPYRRQCIEGGAQVPAQLPPGPPLSSKEARALPSGCLWYNPEGHGPPSEAHGISSWPLSPQT